MLTAVALPGVLLANNEGDSSSGAPNVAAVGLAAAPPSAPEEVDAVAVEEADVIEPVFLASLPPSPETAPVQVAVGTADDTLVARAMATYAERVNATDVCWYDGVEGGSLITVRNPANGLEIECFTILLEDRDPGLITLDPRAFAELADLTDAPVHVEIRT